MAWDGIGLDSLRTYLAKLERYLPAQDKVRTTDATVTTLVSFAIPTDTAVKIMGSVVARRTGGSSGTAQDCAAYTVDCLVNVTAGTAAQVGAGGVTTVGESQAAWAVTLSASGADMRIRVAGAANNNVVWTWSGKTLSVKE